MMITGVESFFVEVPQNPPIAPYHSRYRGQSTTKSILIRLETDNGLVGWGETPQVYLGNSSLAAKRWPFGRFSSVSTPRRSWRFTRT